MSRETAEALRAAARVLTLITIAAFLLAGITSGATP